MEAFIAWIFLIYGLIIGSFLNVCIYRIPEHLPIAKGRSMCTKCHHQLSAIDLIPVFSFLFLGGKCRYCSSPISFRYIAIELLTGACFLISYLTYGLSFYSIALCIFLSALIVAAFIDADTMTIPDRISVILMALGIICAIVMRDHMPFWQRLIGFSIVSLPVLAIAYFSGGFGGGDVKLFAAGGFFLGYKLILLSFLISAVVGGIYSAYLLASKKAHRKQCIAFGPFICVSMAVSALWGDFIVECYLDLFGF